MTGTIRQLTNGHSHSLSPTTFDDLIEARVVGHVGAIEDRLRIEIESLQAEIADLNPDKWPAMMTRSDAASYCGISPAKLDWLVRQEIIPAVIPDGLEYRHYLRSDLDAWMRSEMSGR